jgi:integrase
VPNSAVAQPRVYVRSSSGTRHPLVGRHFGNHGACRLADLSSAPTRHDLRRTAVTRLAEAGCTEDEISSITGLSIKMIRKQVYIVRSKAHSKAGMKKLEDYRNG